MLCDLIYGRGDRVIGICPQCGNYEWDKTVSGSTVKCPECSHTWEFRKLPMFVLTGCSGVGKTTTAQELLQRNINFVVLDADMYHGIMTIKTDEDYQKCIEQMESLSRNIMQSGQPVLWTMAGCLDKLNKTYNRRFFSDIYCLALVCDENELRRRMTEGRGITDENWINSSVDYNNYFKTHTKIDDMSFDTFDITGKNVSETADHVEKWVNSHFV